MNQKASAVQACISELENRIGGDLRSDAYSRMLYSTDASIYQVQPHAVLIPRNIEDVHAAVETAAEFGVPVLARAAGSSLAGQAVGEAIIIDFTRHLDAILDIDPDARAVRVQPGVVLGSLNAVLAEHGLKFGPDPASANRAGMGGIVSNNSTGAHSILYGMTADHVMETNVILSDGSRARLGPIESDRFGLYDRDGSLEGRIVRGIRKMVEAERNRRIILDATPRHWRRCGGYNIDRFVEGASYRVERDSRFNLSNLICGAEGTLAVIEDVTLSLVPLPKQTGLAIVHFDDLAAALSAVTVILESDPSAIELLDRLGMSMCREVPVWRRSLESFVEGAPECILITEYYGESESEVVSKIDRLKIRLTKARSGSGSVVQITSREGQKIVWSVRRAGLGILMSIKGDHKPIPFIEDAAVPTEHLSHYVTEVEKFCNGLGVRVAYYAHASAGCIHIRPLINTKSAREIALLPEITSFAIELLHGNGGVLSSEHGDGRARSGFNEAFYGPDMYGLFREVKGLFDPNNLLNPGNIVNAQQMTINLRYGTDYKVQLPETHLDFSMDMGIDRAVETCNGAGVCRQLTSGTMCPSFMATRDEEHSTRGRANALRAVLSGFAGSGLVSGRTAPGGSSPVSFMSRGSTQGGLGGHRLLQTMDLCLECKACVSECPSSVDMAKLKVEVLAQHHDMHGVPFRARLFSSVAAQNRIRTGPVAPILNSFLGLKSVRWLADRFLGISRFRRLPPVAEESFTSWFERHEERRVDRFRPRGNQSAKTRQPEPLPKVVLFNDTFNTYNYPETSIAATLFLEAAGFHVVLSGHRCCGRPMISKGLVSEAKRAARETIDCLIAFADAGLPIIGLEPSCLLTLKDEYRYLLPGDGRVERVAAKAVLFEEFVAELAESGSLHVAFSDVSRHILFHGHCHQKALIGTASSMTALAIPPGFRVTEIDAGCCGMAGSFGYEKEHYALSQKIGEQRLYPAVREANEETIVAASGVSCREQILHGTGRKALHPAEILWDAVSCCNGFA